MSEHGNLCPWCKAENPCLENVYSDRPNPTPLLDRIFQPRKECGRVGAGLMNFAMWISPVVFIVGFGIWARYHPHGCGP